MGCWDSGVQASAQYENNNGMDREAQTAPLS